MERYQVPFFFFWGVRGFKWLRCQMYPFALPATGCFAAILSSESLAIPSLRTPFSRRWLLTSPNWAVIQVIRASCPSVPRPLYGF